MNDRVVKKFLRQTRGSSEPDYRTPQLSNSDLDLLRSPRALLIDLRPAIAFAAAFIPGSVNLPEFHSPELLKVARLAERSIYLVSSDCKATERAEKYFAKGEPIAGWFGSGVVQEWRRREGETPSIELIRPDTLAVRVAAWKTTVMDLRDVEAFQRAHIRDAIRVPLEDLRSALAGLPHATPLSLICESGAKCSFAASLMWAGGFRNLAIVAGGFEAYVQHRLPLVGPGIQLGYSTR